MHIRIKKARLGITVCPMIKCQFFQAESEGYQVIVSDFIRLNIIPIAFSKSLSCRQLCLGIITMHYLEQMSRRPQLPEGFNDVDF
ncbi:hypothetical protein, partial [Endozoicomonas atrinae]|uniref:hypothetical protein n=1 Tax=Endozoicomonas atrinae TaxID=1333660 RepID=UPI001112E11D